MDMLSYFTWSRSASHADVDGGDSHTGSVVNSRQQSPRRRERIVSFSSTPAIDMSGTGGPIVALSQVIQMQEEKFRKLEQTVAQLNARIDDARPLAVNESTVAPRMNAPDRPCTLCQQLELRLKLLIERIEMLEQDGPITTGQSERLVDAIDESAIEHRMQHIQSTMESWHLNMASSMDEICNKIDPLRDAVSSLQKSHSSVHASEDSTKASLTMRFDELNRRFEELTAKSENFMIACASQTSERGELVDMELTNVVNASTDVLQLKLDELTKRMECIELSLSRFDVTRMNNSPLPTLTESKELISPPSSISTPPPPPAAPPVIQSAPIARRIKVTRTAKSEDRTVNATATKDVDFMAELRSRLKHRDTGKN